MTQAEYKQEIEKLNEIIKNMKYKADKYESLLEDYYSINESLRFEQRISNEKTEKIKQLRETIEQYEKILNRVNISC